MNFSVDGVISLSRYGSRGLRMVEAEAIIFFAIVIDLLLLELGSLR